MAADTGPLAFLGLEEQTGQLLRTTGVDRICALPSSVEQNHSQSGSSDTSAPPPGGHAELDLLTSLSFVHRRHRRLVPMCKTEAIVSEITQDTSLTLQAM